MYLDIIKQGRYNFENSHTDRFERPQVQKHFYYFYCKCGAKSHFQAFYINVSLLTSFCAGYFPKYVIDNTFSAATWGGFVIMLIKMIFTTYSVCKPSIKYTGCFHNTIKLLSVNSSIFRSKIESGETWFG